MEDADAMGKLARWMDTAKETDETLASKLGVSRVQASRLRRRICLPSTDTAKKLAELTSLPAGDFLLEDRAA